MNTTLITSGIIATVLISTPASTWLWKTDHRKTAILPPILNTWVLFSIYNPDDTYRLQNQTAYILEHLALALVFLGGTASTGVLSYRWLKALLRRKYNTTWKTETAASCGFFAGSMLYLTLLAAPGVIDIIVNPPPETPSHSCNGMPCW